MRKMPVFVLFQAGWFACALGAAHRMSVVAVGAAGAVTAFMRRGGLTQLHFGDRLLGEVSDPAFGPAFFATRSVAIRKRKTDYWE